MSRKVCPSIPLSIPVLEKQVQLNTKHRKLSERIQTLGTKMINGSWKPIEELKEEADLLNEATKSFYQTVWELPLEEALSDWVMGDPKVIKLLQSNHLLWNY